MTSSTEEDEEDQIYSDNDDLIVFEMSYIENLFLRLKAALRKGEQLEVRNENQGLAEAVRYSRLFFQLKAFDRNKKVDETSSIYPEQINLDEVTDSYFQKGAMVSMIRELKKNEKGDDEIYEGPMFSDVVLAEKYQCMIRRYLKHRWLALGRNEHHVRRMEYFDSSIEFVTLPLEFSKNQLDYVLEMPSMLFHGPTFHNLMQETRRHLTADDDDDFVDEHEEEEKVPAVLPIDAHYNEIVSTISKHRVTIIRGETGCGKSSRVPVMVMNADDNARMFVSQPRRIAAQSLYRRVSQSVSDGEKLVSLRLGGGTREGGGHSARITFCTAGYLRALASSSMSNDSSLKRFTHLIIDEVHERSVGT